MQLTGHTLDASYTYSPCTIAHVHIQAMAARSTLDSTSILGRLGCVMEDAPYSFIGARVGVTNRFFRVLVISDPHLTVSI